MHFRCRNEAQTGRVTSDACLKIDECDSKAACDGSLQRLATSAPGTTIGEENKPSELVFNVTPGPGRGAPTQAEAVF